MDGFIATVAHTLVVGSSKVLGLSRKHCFSHSHVFILLQDNPATGRRADVCLAAYLASEIAHRMVVPGGEVRGMWLI